MYLLIKHFYDEEQDDFIIYKDLETLLKDFASYTRVSNKPTIDDVKFYCLEKHWHLVKVAEVII